MSTTSPKPVTKGRTVMYVVPAITPDQPKPLEAQNGAEILPAIVVATWSENVANLRVFCDGFETTWRTSVKYDENKAPGTWHWPEIK